MGGGAAIWAAHVAAGASERSAVAKEMRDQKRQRDDEVARARREAAAAVLDHLEAMRDVWSDAQRSPVDNARDAGRLWDLHEKARVRALLLPSDLREEVAVLNRCLRLADELGGDKSRGEGFIFLNTRQVAKLAYETAEERLGRYIAGDVVVPWPPDGLRLRAAHDDLMSHREDEYAMEAHEYESERSEFDAAHPNLASQVEKAKRLRGSSEE